MSDIALIDRLLAETEEDQRRVDRRRQSLVALRDVALSAGGPDSRAGEEGTAAVVAANIAHGFYLRNGAYVCQAFRGFNNDELSHLAFYASSKIQREVPRIVARRQNVAWSSETVAGLRSTGDQLDTRLADLIETTLRTRDQGLVEGEHHDVFLLTAPVDDQTILLSRPIPHYSWKRRGSGYTRKHRYVYVAALASDPADTDELDAGQHNLEVRRGLAR
jgi:hypothetical protein